jgi:hypothetical protein
MGLALLLQRGGASTPSTALCTNNAGANPALAVCDRLKHYTILLDCHALGEVAGLIDVGAFEVCGIISNKL